ncbi:hypothetical protein AK812_SmicGene30394 [Symbiodinium microadriaticum]|uniref:Uncharacterized protein n=1 Tax=Symbiodinium microadriaticum TaxID=2951 RepID=A0A1Q9CZE4_SYMMI|nr:hypothetical protein AK812_SmicGene30394 [Symbiodinium microadriaticum]
MALRGSQYSAAYKKRLRAGLDAVLKFIGRSHKRLDTLAQNLDQLDNSLEHFVNWIYRKCGKRHLSTAKHGLLAVQHLYPQHRRRLHRAWQSIQAWEDIVEVNVRVPLPLSVLCALVIAARAHAGCESGREAFLWDRFSVCLELAFFGLLRPGEVFKLRKSDVSLPDALLVSGVGAVVRIQDLYRFARLYAAAEALQGVQPCRPLPARLPLSRLGSLQSWVSRAWVVFTWQRVFVMFLLAAVLSRPHTHFLVARLLTRVMQQLLRYALSLVIHLVEAMLEELVSQVQGRAAPELSDPTWLGHLPVDIPIEDLVSKEFRLCMQAALEEAQQHQCIANFTAIPGDLYEREIARYTHFCLVPEADICGNLDGRELLPDLDFDLLTSIPLFLKVAGIASTASLGQVNLCRRAVQSFCQQIYTVQTTLLQEQRADICGKKSGKVVGSKKTIRYEASREYEDEVFGLTSVTFQSFLLIILFLWGLASVTEFRSILVWWNVILTLPTAVAAACIVYKYPPGAEAEDDCTVEIAGLTWKTRLSTVFTNLLPRTVLQCVFFVVGIEYLLSVKQISELILNSLALMVLVTIDEMLFAAFTGEQNAIWIQNSEPLQGRSLHWLDCLLSVTHMPLGMFIFLPISATLAFYIQSHVTTTALQAQATYCLCDLKGDDCFAPEFLAGRVAAAL